MDPAAIEDLLLLGLNVDRSRRIKGQRVGNHADPPMLCGGQFPADGLRHRERIGAQPAGLRIEPALPSGHPRDIDVSPASKASRQKKRRPKGVRHHNVRVCGNLAAGREGIEQVQKLKLQHRLGLIITADAHMLDTGDLFLRKKTTVTPGKMGDSMPPCRELLSKTKPPLLHASAQERRLRKKCAL